MYFDFEDYRPEFARIERAISWREGVLLSIIVHLLAVIAALVLPRFLPESANKPVALFALAQQARQNPRFVFVAPRLDTPAAQPPDRAENSDINRRARAPMRAPNPANLLPLSRGNSPERVEEDASRAARGQGPQPPAPQSQQAQASRDPQGQPPSRLPDLPSGQTPAAPAA